jgi:hypothetical protein
VIAFVIVVVVAHDDVDAHPRVDAALPASDTERQDGSSGERACFRRGGFDKLIRVGFRLRCERAVRENTRTF